MARASVSRRLLRLLSFDDVRELNKYYERPPRKSKEEMVDQVVDVVGSKLERLVSAESPWSLAMWNERCVDLGGEARKSFVALGGELEAALDPVFDHFYPATPVAELRGDAASKRALATALGIALDVLEGMLAETHGKTSLWSFVPKVRAEQRGPIGDHPTEDGPEPEVPQKRGTPVPHAGQRVLSTRSCGDATDRLQASAISSGLRECDDAMIASGFYDTTFLMGVIKASACRSIRLLFNGLAGRRLVDQRRELQELVTQTGRSCDVEVKLAFAPGMFHTKLFLFRRAGATRVLVGSANATSAAFARNEEILVDLPDDGQFLAYFDRAWASAMPLNDIDPKARSLIAFLRTGILYFKPTVSLQTTLNPFRELIKELSDQDRERLGGIPLPFADRGTGLGPFNLRLALVNGREASQDDADDESNKRPSVRRFAIETCYGYWVPSCMEEELEQTLEVAGAQKKARWIDLRDQLDAADFETIEGRYKDYLKRVEVELQQIPRVGSHLARLTTDPFDPKRFRGFFNRVRAYLADDERIRRLAMPLVSGPVPELWDDKPAYDEFAGSFFEFLDHIARRPGKKPRVAGALLRRLEVEEPTGPGELREAFERLLGDSGWEDEDWDA
jgi:hypothetical protein